MLSKKQKFLMTVLGLFSLLAGLVAAIPFRSFPGLNKIENVLELEVIIKLAVAAFVLLLSIYPSVKKYQLVKNNREYSKTVLVMTYMPTLLFILGTIVNMVYTLSFDFTAVAMLSVLSDKLIGVVIALFVVFFVFGLYCLFRLHNVVIKLDTAGNVIFDVFSLLMLVGFVSLQYFINAAYNNGYQHLEEYFQGNPLLFFIYILLIVAFGLTIKFISKVVRKDEVLVFYSESDDANKRIKQTEYNRAYNDTLDDYEAYFDENQEAIEAKAVEEVAEVEEEVEELAETEEKPAVQVETIEIEEEEEVEVAPLVVAEVADSEEVKKVEAEKAATAEAIAKAKAEIAALDSEKAALASRKAELKAAQDAYEAELAKQKEVVEVVPQPVEEESAPVEVVRKVDKIVPSFAKMVEYANSFSDHEGFKVVSNAKGNLHKFYIGKKMYLVMQATNSDYRISFITSPEKFVNYLKSRPGELTAPKNLKDNLWVRLVNKGKEEAKFMRQVIKQAVQTAEKQIADEALKKAEERKAKAKERAAARATQKAAEKQAN